MTTLTYWVDEYQRKHSLHPRKRRYSKYSAEEKAHAVRYYMEHDINILQTVKVLGYPSRPLLKAWIEEKEPAEAEKRCQTSKPYVRCTQEERERAVLESCRGDLKIQEVDYYICWYNEKRIKMSLGAMIPLQYRRSLGLAS